MTNQECSEYFGDTIANKYHNFFKSEQSDPSSSSASRVNLVYLTPPHGHPSVSIEQLNRYHQEIAAPQIFRPPPQINFVQANHAQSSSEYSESEQTDDDI